MNTLVGRLSEESLVVDLGSGPGSFDYSSADARVLALDLSFPPQRRQGWGAAVAASHRVPLRTACADLVVCNHTLEHFVEIRQALREIGRILKPGGHLWASIPCGYSFDDRFYRFLFHGGGHVNRFGFESFVRLVLRESRLGLVATKKLYSGFVYLNPPPRDRLKHFPRRARLLMRLGPRPFLEALARWVNYLTRRLDCVLSTRLSLYGWAFIFRKLWTAAGDRRALGDMTEYRNVCFGCGAGHAAETLHPVPGIFGLFHYYHCPACGRNNHYSGDAGELGSGDWADWT
jgi:SAM-dependent methyltransferase